MCGFATVVSRDGGITRELMLDMRDAMVHRGPDEEGLWISDDGRVGMGHRRLSIIDLTHGQQPMASPDGTVMLSYNGELYNHADIRRELEREGRRFETRCDTEVVLAAYERWGDACLDRFDGMFAFSIWDSSRERLFFARDRVGKKPLYYVAVGEGFAFASEIKALLAHPGVERRVDPTALAHYMSFLATPAPDTLFAGIHKVPAGHCGSWDRNQGLAIREWWRVPSAERIDIGLDEAADRVRELFSAAVGKRMMSDVPFGVYLSGGVDSTANVAFMSELSDEPVRTFSVSFADEPGLDELEHARFAAKHFGTEHREIILDDNAVAACLPELIHHQDEPIADPVCVPLLHLAHLTKDSGVTVVQVGEGSDEIFMGYPAYTQVLGGARQLRKARRMLPRALMSAGLRLPNALKPGLKWEFMAESVRHGVPAAHGVSGFSERDKSRLLAQNGYPPALEYLRGEFGSGWGDEEIAAVTLDHELAVRLPELLLMRVDKMTMAASVEARVPFLDRELVEFAARLPIELRWGGGEGKLVLKHALRGIVPDQVLDRKKQGFGAPVWRWHKTMRPLAERELFRDPILEHLDGGALRELLDRPSTPRQGFELWLVMNFALWHRHWVEGEDLHDAMPVAAEAAA